MNEVQQLRQEIAELKRLVQTLTREQYPQRIVERGSFKVAGRLILPVRDISGTSGEKGELVYHTGTNTLRFYNGSSWTAT